MATPRVYTVAELKALPPPTPEEQAEMRAAMAALIAQREYLRAKYGELTEDEFWELLRRDDDDTYATSK